MDVADKAIEHSKRLNFLIDMDYPLL